MVSITDRWSIEVGGHMPFASLGATAAVAYTEFNASVGRSDRPAGFSRTKRLTWRSGNIEATTAGSSAISLAG
jgi:hypothetical protein